MAEALLPEKEPWIVSEALIELGATVCGRNARFTECPLGGSCRAYASGEERLLPIKAAPPATKRLYRLVPVIVSGSHFLIGRGKEGKVMAGLREFPYFDVDDLSKKSENQKEILEGMKANAS